MTDLAGSTRHAVKVLRKASWSESSPSQARCGQARHRSDGPRHSRFGKRSRLQLDARFQGRDNVGVLIIGDYTARIGDPSGRSKERKAAR